ncbi:MAG: hypothetical protein RMJ28_02660 [Nitrososphaerota archaeon]|nr:hypothetical protein [Candidatus Calditenuaceae archaeon]MDW8073124.1 hypothetical protein [Nitrososphaerota archaeon]
MCLPPRSRGGAPLSPRVEAALAISFFVFAALASPVSAQPPPWDIEVYFLPTGLPEGGLKPQWLERYDDRYFPGEVGNLTFQIVNRDCSERSLKPLLRKFPQTWEDDLRPIFERLSIMNETRYILNYTIRELNPVIYGGRKIADWEITVTGYCTGKSIQVVSAKVWFAWPGYGESLSSSVTLQENLRPVDPIKYIFEADISGAYAVFTLPFNFPPDIHSSLFEMQPTITLALRYPSGVVYEYRYSLKGQEGEWWVWGLRGGKYGLFKLSPFRTFSLKITDHEGSIPLTDAKLILEAHMYPYSTSHTVGRDGVALVKRLPDFYSYVVKVRYAPPLIGEEILAYISSHEALELAKAEVLKTEIYTLRVYPVDLMERPLNNATVLMRLLEEPQTGRKAEASNLSLNGYASFYLLPTGNYSLTILWRGVEVFSSSRYIGYHPTLGFSPLSFVARASVSDLVVSAVDVANNSVGAVFDVVGPSPETSYWGLSRRDGVLVITQAPVGSYLVSAVNESATFNSRVEARIFARPGEQARIVLNIYSVILRLLTLDGKPLPDAEIVFHTLGFRSGGDGLVVIPGVPVGVYELRVGYKGVPVYSDDVRVEGVLSTEIVTKVCDVNILFEDFEGAPVLVEWILSGPGGNFSGTGASLYAPFLPDAPHNLRVYFWERGKQFLALERPLTPSEFRGARMNLPISAAKFRVVWSGGEPFNGTLAVDGEKYPITGGVAVTERLIHRPLNVSVETTGGVELFKQEVKHTGIEVQLKIPQTVITVMVHDVLMRPVEGASIVLHSLRTTGYIAAIGRTGGDGVAVFPDLPAALAPYRVEARFGGGEFEAFAAAGVVRFRLDSVVVFGEAIPASLILTGVFVVLAAALSAAIIGRIRAKMAERREEE